MHLSGCDVTSVRFPGPATARFNCCKDTEDGQVRILAPDEEPDVRTLDLERRILE